MILTLAILLGSVTCSMPLPSDDCPQVFKVHGEDEVDGGFNIVFLSDGFVDTELEAYRCAVGLLAQDLMSIEPFAGHADLINVYRVDLDAGAGVTQHASCPAACSSDPLLSELPWKSEDATAQCAALAETGLPAPDHGTRCIPSLGPDRDVVSRPLESMTCFDGVCRLVFPDPDVLDATVNWLSGCGLEANVTVVLENVFYPFGAGKEDVAVATLYGMGYPERYYLLAHELGHAFELYDEHTDGGGSLVYQYERNVAHPSDPYFPHQVYWADACTDRPPHDPAPCEDDLIGEPCHEVQNCEHCDNAPNCAEFCSALEPSVGLFQGAFYSECDYYRPTYDCRMRVASSEYCSVCERYVDELLTEYESELQQDQEVEVPPPPNSIDRTDTRE